MNPNQTKQIKIVPLGGTSNVHDNADIKPMTSV